jgi:zinc transport system ATP-binding protein
MNQAVVFDNVSVAVGGTKILDSVSATIPQGSVTGLVGPNGSGKTTLILTILQQISYTGKIRFGSNQSTSLPRIGYVPQRFQFDRGMPISVIDFLAMGVQRMTLWFGVRKKIRERSLELLKIVHAETLADRRLGVLSGGELQRVLLALAMAQEPELLIMDEPVAGVDVVGEQLFCELLEELRQEKGFTQLMVSHNLSVVLAHATHTILLNRCIIGQGKTKDVLTPDNLKLAYGMHMELPEKQSQIVCTNPTHQHGHTPHRKGTNRHA